MLCSVALGLRILGWRPTMPSSCVLAYPPKLSEGAVTCFCTIHIDFLCPLFLNSSNDTPGDSQTVSEKGQDRALSNYHQRVSSLLLR